MRNETTNRVWERYDDPIRQLVLWGWDKDENPAFCILYGKQKTERDLLKDAVEYELYFIAKGKNGHLPSFPEVKADGTYHNLDLYDTNGSKLKEKKNLKEKLLLPYYEKLPYASIIEEIKEKYKKLEDFRFAENPNQILLLEESYKDQFQTVCQLFCDPSLYMRKKYLNQLLEQKLPKDFYQYILKIGSTEVIAGIFLEMAKRRDDMLLEEAEGWKEVKAFAEKNYMDGVERCATIYCNVMDEKKREERGKDIREHLSDMDLHFLRSENEDEKELDGTLYRKYANDGSLCAYRYEYVRENNRWHRKEILKPAFYKESIYCDGRKLNIIAVKNTIQEAEIYGLFDVLGKAAYYMDAPRMYYYFGANDGGKSRSYFRRYLRRAIEDYGKRDAEIYMNIMKVLFTSYQEGDYLSKFQGHFQSNYFIAHFLYKRAEISPPDYESYSYVEYYTKMREYVRNDQFLGLEGRFEAYPEIWDQHLKETAEIASASKVGSIVKACYYILKENMENGRLESELEEDVIVALSDSFYEPLKRLGEKLLEKYLKNVDNIEEELLFVLLKSLRKELQDIAISYIETHTVSVELLISIAQISEHMAWYPSWKEKVLGLSEEEMVSFILLFFEKREEFKEWEAEEAKDVLHKKVLEVKGYSWEAKERLFSFFYPMLWTTEQMPKMFIDLIEDILFSLEKEELRKLLDTCSLEKRETELWQEKVRIINLLSMIKSGDISDSSQIADLIEKGSSQMLQVLLELLQEHPEALKEKMELFLMFAESPIPILNEMVEKVLHEASSEKRKEQISVLIGSPIERAYSLGISEIEKEYSCNIPKEFMLKLMEHPDQKVKAYIAQKSEYIIQELGNGNTELFLYYVRTLLYLPNKTVKSKQFIYQRLPIFAKKYPEKNTELEKILLDIGGSNCKKDAEQALVAFAKIRNEVKTVEG